MIIVCIIVLAEAPGGPMILPTGAYPVPDGTLRTIVEQIAIMKPWRSSAIPTILAVPIHRSVSAVVMIETNGDLILSFAGHDKPVMNLDSGEVYP